MKKLKITFALFGFVLVLVSCSSMSDEARAIIHADAKIGQTEKTAFEIATGKTMPQSNLADMAWVAAKYETQYFYNLDAVLAQLYYNFPFYGHPEEKLNYAKIVFGKLKRGQAGLEGLEISISDSWKLLEEYAIRVERWRGFVASEGLVLD